MGHERTADLARLYPRFKILLSEDTDITEALTKLGGGISASRVVLETKSTSTYENAIFCAALVKPQAHDRWLLVTDALHMPRAIASFRKAGFHVEPWPIHDDAASELSMVASAIHEWVGLVTYRVLDRT
ncbi:MAG: YdcF family protein [Methyloceanibacter sp.]